MVGSSFARSSMAAIDVLDDASAALTAGPPGSTGVLPPRDISESSGCCEGAAARKIIDGHTLHVSCVTDLIERSISIIEHCILRRGRCAELGLDSLAKARMRGHLPVDRHIEMAIVIKPCLQRLHHVLEHEPVLSWQRINKGKIITAFARAFSPEIRQRRTSHVRCTPSIARPLEHTHARMSSCPHPPVPRSHQCLTTSCRCVRSCRLSSQPS